jgi:Flp pilus assembly protein TadD
VGAPGLTADAAAALDAAIAAHRAGRAAEADAAYAAVLAAVPGHAQALRLRGILKRDLGDLAASASLLRRAAELAPQSADALAELALTHLAAGDLELAESALRRARGRGPAPKALANLGAVLQYRGHLAEAEALYREYLALDPADGEIRCNLITTLLDAGQGDAALAECDAGAAVAPDDPALAAARGAVLVALERPAEALAPLQAALAADPGDDLAAVNLAVALAATGDDAAAAEVLAAALARNPDNARATADLMSLRAGVGQPGAAVDLGRAFLARYPGERLVAGALGYALWDAGADAEAAVLLGTGAAGEALVQVFDADALAGPAPDAAAVARRIASDPALLRAPVTKSTRGGGQTGEFWLHRERELAPLDARFRAAAKAWTDRVAAAGLAGEPVLTGSVADCTLRAWGTWLPAGGRQLPHQHPLGFLSAVAYVAVPDELAAGGDPAAGWLEFGPPPPRYRFRRPVPARRVEPRPGRVAVFPSYLYHGTRPFTAAGERVSVAVDVMPRR